MSEPVVTQEAVDRVMARLGELHGALAPDEQAVLDTILVQAGASSEVSGFSLDQPVRIVLHRKGSAAGLWSFSATVDTQVGDWNGDGQVNTGTYER